MRKLTPAMQDLLDYIKAGGRVHYMDFTRWNEPYYFRADNHKSCTKQAVGLLGRGLVVADKNGLLIPSSAP